MKKRILAILMAAIMCCLQLAEFVPAEKVKAAYSVSEEDIYYRCPEYLDNKAYDNYMARCEERIEKGMSTINDAEGLGASILYSLQNGADIIISELASKAGIGQSTKDKLNKEVVYQLIQAYLSSDTSATNTVSQIGNAYSTISDAYNVANATDLYNYKVSLKNLSLNLSDNQVDKLVDMYTDADTFSKILGYAGNAQKALKIITAYIEMQDLDLAVLNKLDDAFSSMDSEFASAIRSIMSDRTSDFLTFAKKNYLQDEVIKKMVSAVAKYGSSPVVFVKNVCANILGKIYKSFCPTADQIIQAGMCQAYTYLARNKVNKLRKEFKNGKTSAEKIEQYKVVYGFYIITMKTTMDKVAGCVNGSDKSVKQALKSWAGSLSGFSYATYMDRCCSEASADVSAGLLKISGNTVTRKTPSGATIDGNYDSTESIKARLAAIKQKYPPNQGATWKGDWGGATQCFGFARMVFFFLYGKEMPARYYSNARYQYRDENGVNKVGQLTGNFTAAQVQQLFAQAKIGDVIQASTTASSGQHTMIFTGLTSKGITVYDCNAAVNGCAPGGCGINEWERSYSELAKGTYGYGSSNGGITIYRADNYASIYGDGDDVFYDDSANFIIKDGVLVKYTGWQPFVEIPDTVTAIGDEAFLNNKTMIHVLIPDSVKSIGNSAFEGCTSLLSVSIPDSVESIGESAFYRCTSLGYAYLPNNEKYTVIESSLFRGCKWLTEIVIPPQLLEIKEGAFENCSSLISVELPNSIEKLGDEYGPVAYGSGGVFQNCTLLQEVNIPKNLQFLGAYTFFGCSTIDNIRIPKNITKTGYYGTFFAECDSLEHITFDEGITNIAEGLFHNCTSLKEIELPYTITEIGNGAFSGCKNLREISLPRGVRKIGDDYGNVVSAVGGCFQGCTSLKEVKLPKELVYLGAYSFNGCINLEAVEINKKINEVGYYANVFSDCPALKNILFEKGITKIPDMLFEGSNGLEKIEIPQTVTAVGSRSFKNCILLKDIKIPDSVKQIDANAFEGCVNIEEFNFPDTISILGNGVLKGCSKLKKVRFPKTLTKIPDCMFMECSSLENIVTGEQIETIGAFAYKDCVAFSKIDLKNSNVRKIGDSAFSGCKGLIMVDMGNQIETIGNYVFSGCSNLEEILLSETIKVIPKGAFEACLKLKKIILTNGIQEVEEDAFKECINLREIFIPCKTKKISSLSFSYLDILLIRGVAGSYAEQYAKENDIAFVAQQIATEKITLTETELTLGRNEKYQLTAGLNPMDSTDEVIWSSSDEKIAKVDKTGNVEAISAGEAVITVKAGEKTATCKVTVNIPITSIYLNKTSIELNSIGDSYQLNASYYPSDADGAIIWKSDDEGVASVDQTGKVTAVGKGTTTITVSCGSVKDTCTVVSKGESDGSQIIPSPGSQPSVKPNPDNQPANTPKPSMTPQVPTKGNIPQSSQTVNDGKNSGQMASLTKIKGVVAKNQKKCKVKVTWKKVPNSLGYQIQYATNKKFKKAKKKTVKSTFVTLKKLKKKKTYFIRIRAYKIADGKKVYGKWSSVKKVKVKKR